MWGQGVAVGAAATGLADWSDSYGAERCTGLWHALLTTTALLLYLVSLIFRPQASRWESLPGALLGTVVCGPFRAEVKPHEPEISPVTSGTRR